MVPPTEESLHEIAFELRLIRRLIANHMELKAIELLIRELPGNYVNSIDRVRADAKKTGEIR
jgi:hypothetical protein